MAGSGALAAAERAELERLRSELAELRAAATPGGGGDRAGAAGDARSPRGGGSSSFADPQLGPASIQLHRVSRRRRRRCRPPAPRTALRGSPRARDLTWDGCGWGMAAAAPAALAALRLLALRV